MQKITTAEDLKSAIQQLEKKQTVEWTLLHDQFLIAYESLRPVNLITGTLRELTTAPDFKGNILETTLSLAAGYLFKKVVVGATHNPLKLVFGTLLQMGITSIVSKNTDGIKSASRHVINNIFRKKDKPAPPVNF
jgi:hypothetical protein